DTSAHLIAIVGRVRRDDVAISAAVGGWNELIDQRERRLIQTIRRDDVAGEGGPRQRIANRRRSEIPGALPVRQHHDVLRVTVGVAMTFVMAKRKYSVARDRSTQTAAELVLFQLRFRLRRQGEEVARLKRIVAVELPGGA